METASSISSIVGVANAGWVQVGMEYMTYLGITSSPVLTLRSLCLQNVTRGATAVGLTSSAASYTGGQTITPINPLSPADTTDYFPAFTVGTAAFAFPNRAWVTAYEGNPFLHGMMDHVKILGTWPGSFPTGNTAAIYIQGVAYASRFDHIYINGPIYGFNLAPPFSNFDSYIGSNVSSDDMVFNQLEINSATPFMSYIGNRANLSASTFYSGGGPNVFPHGFSIYQMACHVPASCSGTNGGTAVRAWDIEGLYQESNNGGGSVNPVPPMSQIGGTGHIMNGNQMASYLPLNLYPIVWDASNADANFLVGSGLPAIQVNGSGNFLSLDNTDAGTATDN